MCTTIDASRLLSHNAFVGAVVIWEMHVKIKIGVLLVF